MTEALTQGRNVLHYTTSDTNTVVVLGSGGYGNNYYRKYDVNIPAGSEVNYTVYRGYSSFSADGGSFYADSSDGEYMIELSNVTPSAIIGTITTPKDITALYASYYSGDQVYRNAIFDLKVTGWQ